MIPTGTPLPFKPVSSALLDNSKPFPPIYLHQFSDLSREDLNSLKKIWLQIEPARRIHLLEDLEELAEADTIVCFDDLAQLALTDPEAPVRVRAINMLWEAEDPDLVPTFLKMMESDPETDVRAAATGALGKYVYLGETEEIPAETQQNIEDSLLLVSTGREPSLIRRRALESLGFSHRDEVATLIEKAFSSGERDWLISALYAMGRSYDQRWEKSVLAMLDNPDDDIRYEAIRAAGELEMKSAHEILLEELKEGIDEYDMRMTTVWSLSQIGGKGVREEIEDLLEDCQDDEESQYLEEALDNLSFTEDFSLTDIFDFDVDDDSEDNLTPDDDQLDKK